MRLTAAGILSFAAVVLFAAMPARAQDPTAAPTDPRLHLKAGFRDPGIAVRNMELIASLPKPQGFFDPKAPAGLVSPPEQTREEEEEVRRIEREHERAGTPAPPRPGANNLNLGNSDLAFRQTEVFIGNRSEEHTSELQSPCN